MTSWRAVCEETRKHGSAGGRWKRAACCSTSLAAYPTQSSPGGSEATMTYLRRLGFVFCFLFALLVVSVEQGSSQDNPARQTTLRVLVPEKSARVQVNGKAVAKKK